MTIKKLKNVPLKDFRLFLEKAGCKSSSIKGGHEKWTKPGLLRPVIVQTHVDPVPEFIIKNALRNLSLTTDDFFRILFDC